MTDPSICYAVQTALLVDAEGRRMDEDLQKQVETHLEVCAVCRETREKGTYPV